VTAALSGDDEAAVHRIAGARQKLRELMKIDPALEPLAQRLDAAAVELDDLARTLEDSAGDVVMDPQELDRLESRLALMAKLARKHGVAVDELPAREQALRKERDALQNADTEKSSLDAQLEQAQEKLCKLGRKLSTARKSGAEKLSKQVTAALRPLAMAKAELKARLESHEDPAQASRTGFDRCTFELASNAGEPMRPLAKVASGGELSRVTLALQSVLYDRSEVPTYVFDEVDAGIGGAVAEVVGQTLRRLGERRQVLCVTHLAQIAALSDQHYRVEKKTNGGRTSSHVAELRGQARKEELARMLGGVEITEAVRRHAEELLGS
jgi:DNA repair protein RecN (Recombination protein N)